MDNNYQRKTILETNNSAQRELNRIIDTLEDGVSLLSIEQTLYGDLDFSVLSKFTNIKSIVLTEGNITSVINIPEWITQFKCSGNLIDSLDSLPAKLIQLECDRNQITSIHLDGLNHLRTLNLSYNRVKKLEDLPQSLVKIYCTDNLIVDLDVSHIIELKTLHVSNNPVQSIKMPAYTIPDFKMENTPDAQILNADEDAADELNPRGHAELRTKIDYKDAFLEYLKMKNSYEEKISKTKKKLWKESKSKRDYKNKVAKLKPQCINCKRPVGTIFSNKERKYMAKCGDDSHPCMNIVLYASSFYNMTYYIDLFKESVENVKEEIIKQKLSTIFSYISERESMKLFKENIKQYNEDSLILKNILDEYDYTFNNSVHENKIREKNELIGELISRFQTLTKQYKESQNEEVLKAAMEIHVKELMPELELLRKMKYGINEIIQKVENGQNVNVLFQHRISLEKMDYLIDEHPHVEKYKKT
jgi:hypothetical protein